MSVSALRKGTVNRKIWRLRTVKACSAQYFAVLQCPDMLVHLALGSKPRLLARDNCAAQVYQTGYCPVHRRSADHRILRSFTRRFVAANVLEFLCRGIHSMPSCDFLLLDTRVNLANAAGVPVSLFVLTSEENTKAPEVVVRC